MRVKSCILGVLLFGVTTYLWAAEPADSTKANKFQVPSCHCLKITDHSIQIDGLLTEPAWDKAEKIDFRGLADGAIPPKPSFARLLWDDQYLYVGYNISDTNVVAFYGDRRRGYNPQDEKGPYAGEPEIMYRDTFVKLFVDPDGDGLNYVEIHVNPINNKSDLVLKHPYVKEACDEIDITFEGGKFPATNPAEYFLGNPADWFWDCEGFQSAVQIQGTLNHSEDCDQGWTVEMAVPWTALKPFSKGDCPPKAGQKWRLHAGVVYKPEFNPEKRRHSKHVYWTWPALGIIDCHRPARWGFLVFDEKSSLEAEAGDAMKWKMTWCWTLPCKNRSDLEDGIKKAKALGFNAMEWSQAQAEFPEIFINICRENKIESYYCISPKSATKQKLLDSEYTLQHNSQNGGEPLDGDIGKVIDKGCINRPCFAQEDALKNAQEDVDKAIRLGFDGIAFDFVGYCNFHGCYCPLCCELRKNYIDSRPGMSEKEAETRFSEESIIRFYDSIISYAKSAKPDIKTTCHIYPVFMPDILYGNLLPVDYCGQTVSWFFQPHWELGKIRKYSETVAKEEGRYHPKSTGTPFIGFFCKDNNVKDRKTAERMREEIQIVKKASAKGIQIVELGHILADNEVSRVVAEELGGNPSVFTNVREKN